MSSYGLIVMVFSCCVSGSAAAVHTGDAGSSPWVWVPLNFEISIDWWAIEMFSDILLRIPGVVLVQKT